MGALVANDPITDAREEMLRYFAGDDFLHDRSNANLALGRLSDAMQTSQGRDHLIGAPALLLKSRAD